MCRMSARSGRCRRNKAAENKAIKQEDKNLTWIFVLHFFRKRISCLKTKIRGKHAEIIQDSCTYLR